MRCSLIASIQLLLHSTEASLQSFSADPSAVISEDSLYTEEEIFNLLLSIDTSKVSGPDGILGKMLRNTAPSISPSITNLSIRSGKIPHQWKVSSIVPIPKSTSGTDNPTNY